MSGADRLLGVLLTGAVVESWDLRAVLCTAPPFSPRGEMLIEGGAQQPVPRLTEGCLTTWSWDELKLHFQRSGCL